MYHYLQTIFTQRVNYKMYQINHLNILLMLKKKIFDIIYHDLHQKKWFNLWNTTRQLLRTDLKILTGKRQTVWLHLHVELRETICFFEKGFDREPFFEKKPNIFSYLRWRKNFIIRNIKLQPLKTQNLIFDF